jgi:hypothetical protein
MNEDKGIPHLGAIYQSVVQDIAFLKRQQFSTTSSVVLIYAALVVLECRLAGSGWRLLLSVVAVLAWVFGLTMILQSHRSVEKGA